MMKKSFSRMVLFGCFILCTASFIARSSAAFLPPQSVNSDHATDTNGESSPVVKAGGNNTWIAVWVGASSNGLDSRGNDPSTGSGYNEDLFYARSTDNGQTWSQRSVLKTNAASDQFDDIEPDIATDGQGRWMVVWRSKDPLNGTVGFDTDVLMTFSSDNGLTWSAPKPVNNEAVSDPGGFNTDSSGGAQDDYPIICTDRQGHWMVTWIRYDNRSGHWQTSAVVAVSNNNGATWSDPVVLQTRSESGMYSMEVPKLATDNLGRWIVVWSSRINSGAYFDNYFSISENNGASWSPAAPIVPPGPTDTGDDKFADIAADGLGHWVAIWHSVDTLGGTIGADCDILYSISMDHGQTWSAAAPLNTDAATDGAGNDVYPHLIYDGTGQWVATWLTNKLGGDLDLYYATMRLGEGWSDPRPLNPWAGNDNALDGGNGRSVCLANDRQGNWMAIWNSAFDLATSTSKDLDIVSILYQASALAPFASAATLSSITWNWNSAPGATGYKVWADVGVTTPTTLRTVTATGVTSWTMTGLSPNTSSACRVAALIDAGETSPSAPGIGWTAIEPVTGLVFGNITLDSIGLAPAVSAFTNLTSASSGLLLTNDTAGAGSGWRQAIAPWTSTGLTPNTAYTFSGRSRNGGGAATAPVSAGRITLAGPPRSPANVHCNRTTGGWYAPGTSIVFDNPAGFGAGTHGASAYRVSGFRVAWDTNPAHTFGGGEWLWNSGTLTQTPFGPGEYYLHAQSFNSQAVVTTETLDLGPYRIDALPPSQPAPPEGPGPVTPTSTATFTWLAAIDGESGVASYECQAGTAPGAGNIYNGNVGGALSKTVTVPVGGTVYCRVRAIDRAGNIGPWSASSAGVFRDTPPNVPTVAIDPAAPRTLDDIVPLPRSTDPDPGDSIVEYRYEWRLSGNLVSTSTTLANTLTTKGQQWTLTAWARDSYGAWSQPGSLAFTIANSPPTQPIVEILPKPAQAGEDLIVDIQIYSTDPDGDPIGYDFVWLKSTDGGANWTHKTELDGSSQVSGLYIHDGELWEVRYIPYEKAAAKIGAMGKPLARVEGQYGWDRAFIGVNNPPKLSLEAPLLQRQAGGTLLSVGWTASDGDGDPLTLDLEWTNTAQTAYQPLAGGLAPRQGTFQIVADIPLDRPLTIRGVIRDAKGAVVQALSAPAVILPPVPSLVVDYLLGSEPDGTGFDINLDQIIDVADVLRCVQAALPAPPVPTAPAEGAAAVSLTPTLDWANGAHALSYQIYVWKANTARPGAPTASGLTASGYYVSSPLLKNTVYWWQVVAVGNAAKIGGPVWSFTTRP